MIREIKIPTSEKGFLKAYLRSINGILDLTPKQLNALETMLMENAEVTCTKDQRKRLVDLLGVKDIPQLNNVVKALKDKGILRPNPEGKGYVYNPLVVPSSSKVTLQFVTA